MKRIATLLGTLLIGAAPHLAQAQNFPTRPITIVVPAAPGGVSDVMARVLAKHFGDAWGQQVIVENRGGASGMIAVETVSKAPPDGYTTLSLSGSMWTLPFMQSVPYDPVRDFAPIFQRPAETHKVESIVHNFPSPDITSPKSGRGRPKWGPMPSHCKVIIKGIRTHGMFASLIQQAFSNLSGHFLFILHSRDRAALRIMARALQATLKTKYSTYSKLCRKRSKRRRI